MGLNFFKPNKSVKGALADFTFNSKDQALYLQLVRQTGYDDQRHVGSFKDGARINIKFNASEIGGFLRSLRELKETKFFHNLAVKKSIIVFGPYNAKDSNELAGFGLRINQQEGEAKETYSIPFNLDEAYLLEEYLKYVLTHFFDAIYSEDKQRAAAYLEKKNGAANKKATPTAKSTTSNVVPADEPINETPSIVEDDADLF